MPDRSGARTPHPALPSGSAPDPYSDDPSPDRSDAPLLDALIQIALAATRPAEDERIRRTIVDEAGSLFGADTVALSVPVPEMAALRTQTATGALASGAGEMLPLEASLEGAALAAGRALASPDHADDPRAYRVRERALLAGPALALPLRVEGEVVGALLVVRDPRSAAFTDAELEQGRRLAEAAAAALQISRVYAEVRGAEDQLRTWRSSRAALAWRERYDRLAWSQRAVALEFDPGAQRIVWGDTAQAVFGYPAAAFGETPDEWAEKLHADDRPEALAVLRTTNAEGPGAQTTCRVAHAFGGYRTATLHCFAGGPGQATVGVLAEAAGEIPAAPPEMQGRFEAVREIIRALRHEINNPLSVVIGEAQLLRDEALGSLDPALRHSVVAIAEESLRINELIRRLSVLEDEPRESYMNEQGGINFPEE